MKHWMRKTIIAALMLCSGDVLAAESITLRIGFLPGPTDLALAKQHGTLEKALSEHHVHVVWKGPFVAAAPAYEALNAGAIDMTTGSSTAFVTAISAGLPISLFAYQAMPAEGEGIVVPNHSNIHTLADLRGKNVAVNKGGTGEYLLSVALSHAGIPENSVKKAYLSPSDTGAAFVEGHVDAWAIWEPFLSLAKKSYDARLLINGKQLGSENAVGYFVSNDFAKEHPEVLKWVYAVLQQENHWAKAHPLEAGKIWASQIRQSGDSLAAQLGNVNTVPVTTVNDDAVIHVEHIADWYKQKGLITHYPDIRQHIINLSQ